MPKATKSLDSGVGTVLFKETFNKVVLTGNDLVDFIEMVKAVRGLGRAVKSAIAAWIAKNANPYYAQKYRRQIADAIRLSRFKGEDAIYAYILNAYSKVKGNTDEKLAKAYEQYPDLAAQRDFVSAVESGDLASAAALLKEKNLDADSVMTHIGAIMQMVGGCTYMEASVKYMLENNIKADYAVFLTDTEEYGEGWLASWKEYHKRFPNAVAFVLRGDSYMTSPIPEDEAKKLNVYQIFGWNDSVIDYMKFVLETMKE